MLKRLFYIHTYLICISLPVDYQVSSSPPSPHDESQQQHGDQDKNSNAKPEVKSKPIEQESQNITVAQEETWSETTESKEVLPCSSPVGTATGIHMYALCNVQGIVICQKNYSTLCRMIIRNLISMKPYIKGNYRTYHCVITTYYLVVITYSE